MHGHKGANHNGLNSQMFKTQRTVLSVYSDAVLGSHHQRTVQSEIKRVQVLDLKKILPEILNSERYGPEITTVSRIHPLRSMNVFTKCQGNPSNSSVSWNGPFVSLWGLFVSPWSCFVCLSGPFLSLCGPFVLLRGPFVSLCSCFVSLCSCPSDFFKEMCRVTPKRHQPPDTVDPWPSSQ